MNYNRIAELIIEVSNSYDYYCDIIFTLNFHSGLISKDKLRLPKEDLKFESFEEEYLTSLKEGFYSKGDELKEKYKDLYFDVDSDDYK